ncbi:MAG TPA: acetate/propionate family kinase [Thermodesulfobacteriota bacterium]|nr:acetate/propionate family kinase [Thermodesulfobacteriota bacterium]
MSDSILVLNAGSSSLKFSVFLKDSLKLLLRGQIEGILTKPHFVARADSGDIVGEEDWPSGTNLGHGGAVEFLFKWGRTGVLEGHGIAAAGHRVVHGGLEFTKPVVIDNHVISALERLEPLAPLHQPHNLAAIKAIMQRVPELPQVACFDTSFHRTQPAIEQIYAIPRKYTDEGVRRYGFHGLSYEYISSVLPKYDEELAAGRAVVAHLGNGASMCAMRNGRSISSTMGFTAVGGLPMGTRCGAIDPGILLYLMNQHGMDAQSIENLIYNQSGLLGVSGISSDMRALLASKDPRAQEAVDLFVYRIDRELGSLAALGGIDGIVFTGGIGENSAIIRARVCRDAKWLGLDFDEKANETGGPQISKENSRISAWVIPTNEELMIATHTKQMLLKKGD